MTDKKRWNGRVTFFHDDIIAFLELDPNETYVPIGRLCARLGIDRAKHERQARAHALLAEGIRKLRVEVEDGLEEQAWCLRIDLLPLWLTTLDASQASVDARSRLEMFQRETMSLLWQSFKPQGYGVEDVLLPARHEQTPAEQAYVAAVSMATLARHQMLLERQLDTPRDDDEQGADPWASSGTRVEDPQAATLAQTARRVAQTLAQRTYRNEYHGVYSGLHRQFGISSYRRMPAGRLREAMEWLERWHGDMLGEPEPPPDI